MAAALLNASDTEDSCMMHYMVLDIENVRLVFHINTTNN